MKNVGIYAGSFNPFHVGHDDIYRQATRVFDEVIIAQCFDRNKEKPEPILLDKNRKVVYHNGMLAELLKSTVDEKRTLVRGLRNSFDVGHEDNLRNTLQDYDPSINVVYFFCQKKYEHVSSTMIRSLYDFGYDVYKKYLIN